MRLLRVLKTENSPITEAVPFGRENTVLRSRPQGRASCWFPRNPGSLVSDYLDQICLATKSFNGWLIGKRVGQNPWGLDSDTPDLKDMVFDLKVGGHNKTSNFILFSPIAISDTHRARSAQCGRLTSGFIFFLQIPQLWFFPTFNHCKTFTCWDELDTSLNLNGRLSQRTDASSPWSVHGECWCCSLN